MMKSKAFKVILIASALSFALAINCWAAEEETLLFRKTVSVKNLDINNVVTAYIQHIHISKDNDDLIVSGDIDPFAFRFPDRPQEYVEISLIDEDGTVLKTISAALHRLSGKYGRLISPYFNARFKDALLLDNERLVVLVTYRPKLHE